MAVEDAQVSSFLYHVILPVVIGIFSLVLLFRYGKPWRSRSFAYLYTTRFLPTMTKVFAPHKEELFADMADLISKDPELRNKGIIRILEIGVGPGANCIYYPKNCHLVCYDPNPHFRSMLFERCKETPDVNLQRLVVSGAENLVDTADSSVDAVVSTLVLCSVKNLEASLKEVLRVLAPGGKFYFLEHSIAPVEHFLHRVHILLNPLWKLLFDGCHLSRDTEAAVRKIGFSQVKVNHYEICEGGIEMKITFKRVVAGTAEK